MIVIHKNVFCGRERNNFFFETVITVKVFVQLYRIVLSCTIWYRTSYYYSTGKEKWRLYKRYNIIVYFIPKTYRAPPLVPSCASIGPPRFEVPGPQRTSTVPTYFLTWLASSVVLFPSWYIFLEDKGQTKFKNILL